MSREADFSAAPVVAAFDKIKNSKNPENYVVFGFEGKSATAKVVATGTGGLDEIKANLKEDQVEFAVLRVIGADVQKNVVSNREKWVVINWIGKKVGILQKAKVSSQSQIFKAWLKGISITASVDSNSTDELTIDTLSTTLLKAGGAHKPTKYIFGPGQEYDIVHLLGSAGAHAAAGFTSQVSGGGAKSPTSETKSPTSPPVKTTPVAQTKPKVEPKVEVKKVEPKKEPEPEPEPEPVKEPEPEPVKEPEPEPQQEAPVEQVQETPAEVQQEAPAEQTEQPAEVQQEAPQEQEIQPEQEAPQDPPQEEAPQEQQEAQPEEVPAE